MKKKSLQILNVQEILQCPLCKQALHYDNKGSLICTNRHCFDISSQGYVNFVQNQKSLRGYDTAFYESRRNFLQDGFYDHIAGAIAEIISAQGRGLRIVDAGCGEGFYPLKLAEQGETTIIAFDYAKEAIKIASKGISNICWMVADITNIPLQNSSIDCLLNIYTPANYMEFERVLAPDGILVKVIPGVNHLLELRQNLRGRLRNENYSNQQVIDGFTHHFELIDRRIVSQTLPVDERQLKYLLDMTPLMFGVNDDAGCSNITAITIEAEILTGRPPVAINYNW